MLDLSLKIAFIYNILEMFHEQTRDSHANKNMREKSWFRSIRNSFISELNRQTWQLKRSSVKWNNPDNRHCVSFFSVLEMLAEDENQFLWLIQENA